MLHAALPWAYSAFGNGFLQYFEWEWSAGLPPMLAMIHSTLGSGNHFVDKRFSCPMICIAIRRGLTCGVASNALVGGGMRNRVGGNGNAIAHLLLRGKQHFVVAIRHEPDIFQKLRPCWRRPMTNEVSVKNFLQMICLPMGSPR